MGLNKGLNTDGDKTAGQGFWINLFLALVCGGAALISVGCSHKSSQPAAGAAQNVSPTTEQGKPPVTEAPQPSPQTSSPQSPREGLPVHAEMRNVLFRFSPSVAAHIETLSGELLPTGSNSMPDFGDKTSFAVRVKSARIDMPPDVLAALMNDYVFAKPDAPLKDLSMTIDGNLMRIKGRLHSKGDIPFEQVVSLSVSSDGRLRIHSEKIKAFKLPMKKIMSLLGIDLGEMLGKNKPPGIDTDKNDLLLDMSRLLPPPQFQGVATAVRLQNGRIQIVLGTGEMSAPLEKGNYMAFKGNRVRFGRLVMDDADITVLDLDPADPLDWYQERYKDQLVAGYSKTTPSFGLRAYVKDFAKLPHGPKDNAAPVPATAAPGATAPGR